MKMKQCNSPITRPSKMAFVVLLLFLVLTACSMRLLTQVSESHNSEPTSEGESITLYYGEGAQMEIMGPQGQRVLIDVTDPSVLSRPADENDFLLTTHFHFDHYNQDFIDTFPGKILEDRQGKIGCPGLSITGIAGFHTERTWDKKNPAWDNYIFVVETGGVRIAHFGDIGQDELTAEQLLILGRIDIAITQFINPFSQMSLENEKGYRLMDQVRPKIIIPHHGASTDDAIRLAMARWQVVCAKSNRLPLSRQTMPDRTTVIVMGEMADYTRKAFNLEIWP